MNGAQPVRGRKSQPRIMPSSAGTGCSNFGSSGHVAGDRTAPPKAGLVAVVGVLDTMPPVENRLIRRVSCRNRDVLPVVRATVVASTDLAAVKRELITLIAHRRPIVT